MYLSKSKGASERWRAYSSALKRVIQESSYGPGRVFELCIKALIIVSLISFCFETLPSLSDGVQTGLWYLEVVIVVIFTVEYLLRLCFAERKLGFIFSFYGLVDLVAVLPFYVSTGVDLRSIRVVRLLRVFHALKLLRYSRAIQRFRRAFVMMREELVVFLMSCGFLIYIASVGIYYFERTAQPEAFRSIFHAMWWAVATLTTVGYGDVYPVTVGGRLFTFAILMIGLGIVAVPAGLIASALSEVLKEEKEGANTPEEMQQPIT